MVVAAAEDAIDRELSGVESAGLKPSIPGQTKESGLSERGEIGWFRLTNDPRGASPLTVQPAVASSLPIRPCGRARRFKQ